MDRPLRVVCDTNFWISALNWRGLAYRLKEQLADGQFINVVSGEILYEVAHVLRRDLSYSDTMAYQALADIFDLSVLVSPQFPVLNQVRVSRNAKDNMGNTAKVTISPYARRGSQSAAG